MEVFETSLLGVRITSRIALTVAEDRFMGLVALSEKLYPVCYNLRPSGRFSISQLFWIFILKNENWKEKTEEDRFTGSDGLVT